jgi:extradiol dioxygenase family protein
MGASFVPQEHCNHVDKYDVPVPHFGIVLTKD